MSKLSVYYLSNGDKKSIYGLKAILYQLKKKNYDNNTFALLSKNNDLMAIISNNREYIYNPQGLKNIDKIYGFNGDEIGILYVDPMRVIGFENTDYLLNFIQRGDKFMFDDYLKIIKIGKDQTLIFIHPEYYQIVLNYLLNDTEIHKFTMADGIRSANTSAYSNINKPDTEIIFGKKK